MLSFLTGVDSGRIGWFTARSLYLLVSYFFLVDFTQDWVKIHHRMHVKPLSRGIPVQCCSSSFDSSCCSRSRLPRVLGHVTDFALLRVFFYLQMPLVTKINSKDFFLANLICCSHLTKIVSNIKNKLTLRKIHMFRKTLLSFPGR